MTEVQNLHLAIECFHSCQLNQQLCSPFMAFLQPSPKNSRKSGIISTLEHNCTKQKHIVFTVASSSRYLVSHAVLYYMFFSALLFKPLLDRHCVKKLTVMQRIICCGCSLEGSCNLVHAVGLDTHKHIQTVLHKELTLPSTVIKKISIKKVVQTRQDFALGLLKGENSFQLSCLKKISKRRRTTNSFERLV